MAANPWKGIPYATPTQAGINKKAAGWQGVPYALPEAEAVEAPVRAPAALKQSLSLDPITQEAVDEQRQGIKDLQGLALSRLESTPTRTDISPLLGLIDSWTGSGLAKTYKPGESAATGTEALQKSLEAVQQRKGDVSKLLENAELRSDSIQARKEAAAEALAQKKAEWKLKGFDVDENGNPVLIAGGLADIENKFKKAQTENVLAEAIKNRALANAAGKKGTSGKTLPAGQAEAAGTATAAAQALEDVTNLVNQNEGMMGPVQGRWSALLGKAQVGDSGKQAATINADLKQRAQVIGKYLEGGKLTDSDISRYVQQLPQLSDAPEVARNKVDALRRLLAQKQESELAALQSAGYNTEAIGRIAAPKLPGLDKKAAATGGLSAAEKAELAQLKKELGR